jgi:hypothetical protein
MKTGPAMELQPAINSWTTSTPRRVAMSVATLSSFVAELAGGFRKMDSIETRNIEALHMLLWCCHRSEAEISSNDLNKMKIKTVGDPTDKQ